MAGTGGVGLASGRAKGSLLAASRGAEAGVSSRASGIGSIRCCDWIVMLWVGFHVIAGE
jgi:hypothetical protein